MTKKKWLCANLIALSCLTGFFLKENPNEEMESYLNEASVSIKPKANLDLGELPQERKYVPLKYTGKISPFDLKGFVYPKETDTIANADAEKCPGGVCGTPPAEHMPYFLEGYDLMDLKMVGTMGDAKGNFKALIQTPNAGVLFTKEGEYLGRNNGHIERVDFDRLKIKEKHRVSRGWQDKEEMIKILN